jgi:hypothetical protein
MSIFKDCDIRGIYQKELHDDDAYFIGRGLCAMLPPNAVMRVGGDVRLYDCQNCLVHTASEKTVVVEGLDGYIVAESKDRLLVCRLSEEQHIKEYSA